MNRGRDTSPRKVPFSSGDSLQSSYRVDNRSLSPRSYRGFEDDDVSVSRYRSPRLQRGPEPSRTYSTNSVSDRTRSLSPRASRHSSSESVSNLRSKFEKHPQNQGSFISPPDMSAPRSIIGHFVKLKSSVEESVHSEVFDEDDDELQEDDTVTVDSRSHVQSTTRRPGYIPTHDYASWRHQSPGKSPTSRDSRARSPRTRSLSPRPSDRPLQFPSAHLLPAAPPKKKPVAPPPQAQPAPPAPPVQQQKEDSRSQRSLYHSSDVAMASSSPRERPNSHQQQQQPIYHHVPQQQHHLQSSNPQSPPQNTEGSKHHHHNTFERMVDETERNLKEPAHQKSTSPTSPSYAPIKSNERVDLYNKTKPHHYAVNVVKDTIQRKNLTVENQAEVHYEKADAFRQEEIRRAKADAASKEMRKMKIDLTVNSAVKAALERVHAERKLSEMSQPMQKYKSRSAVKSATSSSLTSTYSPEQGYRRRSLSDDEVSNSSTMTFEASMVNRRTRARNGENEEPKSPRSPRSLARSPDNLQSTTRSPLLSSDKVSLAHKYSPQTSQSSITTSKKYQNSPNYASPLRERDSGEEPGLAIVLSASRSAIKAQHEHEIGTLSREYEARLKVAESKVRENYGAIQEKLDSMEADHAAKIKELTESQDNALESLALESVALLSSESEKVALAEKKLQEVEARLMISEAEQEKNKIEYDATVEALTRKSAARFAQYEDKLKSLEKKMGSSDHQLSQTSKLHTDEINHLENKVSKLTSTNRQLDETKHELEVQLEEVNKKLKIAEITIKHAAADQEARMAKIEKEHAYALAKLTNELTAQKPVVDENILSEQEQQMINLHKEKMKKLEQAHAEELQQKQEEQLEKLGKDFVQEAKDKKEQEVANLKAEILKLKDVHTQEVAQYQQKIAKIESEKEEETSRHEYEILELNKMLEGYESAKKEMELKLKEALTTIGVTAAASSSLGENITQLQHEVNALKESNQVEVTELKLKHEEAMKNLELKLANAVSREAVAERKQSKGSPIPARKQEKLGNLSKSPSQSEPSLAEPKASEAKMQSPLNSFMSKVTPAAESQPVKTPTTPPLSSPLAVSPTDSPPKPPTTEIDSVGPSPAPRRGSLADFMAKTPSQKFPAPTSPGSKGPPKSSQKEPEPEVEVAAPSGGVSKLSAFFEKNKN